MVSDYDEIIYLEKKRDVVLHLDSDRVIIIAFLSGSHKRCAMMRRAVERGMSNCHPVSRGVEQVTV